MARSDLHVGIVDRGACRDPRATVVLWRTVYGFAVRLAGASDRASHYAGRLAVTLGVRPDAA